MKHVLIYLGDETHKKEILEKICSELNLPHTFLDDEALNQSIGYLFQINGYHKKKFKRKLSYVTGSYDFQRGRR